MRLASKLAAALVLAVTVPLVVEAFLAVQQEEALLEADLRRDATRLGRTLRLLLGQDSQTASLAGESQDLLRRVSEAEEDLSVRWIRLDEVQAPAAPSVLGAEDLARIRDGEVRHRQDEGSGGDGALLTYVPVRIDGAWQGAIEIRQPLAVVGQRARQALIRLLIHTTVVASVGALLVMVLGMRWIGRPMSRLTTQVRHVAAGNLEATVDLDTNDEISALAAEFNSMCAELADARCRLLGEEQARTAAIEELRHADRLRTVGRLAAGVAHELGTPLNVVLGHATLIAEGGLTADETSESAQIAQKEVRRITRIVQRLLDFARRRPPEKRDVDLVSLTKAVVDMLQPIAHKANGTLSAPEAREPIIVQADPSQVEQVLHNLIMNGLQAGGQEVHVEVRLRLEHADPPPHDPAAAGRYVRVDVRDDGRGVAEEVVDHLFEPFFTTKQRGEGTGLGLSIAQGLVREHGGWIAVESKPDQGSCFSVFLPLGDEA